MTAQRIYLDYNASTPIDPAVAAAMRPFLEDHYGNPSSGHWAAAPAKAALETSRGQVAALLGCQADEIVFTSGGSEANNLALKGVFFAQPKWRSHHHHAYRAPGDYRTVPVSRTPRRTRHLLAGGRHRSDRSRRPSQGDDAEHDPGQHHARQQRGRHDPANRGVCRGSPASTAFCFTPTPLNRSARSRPT